MAKKISAAAVFKKICAVVTVVALLVTGLVLTVPTVSAQESTSDVSRLINVVYDDSNSMIWNTVGGKRVSNDAWCQAKYSLEVFSSMMQADDVMNVYFMSQFYGKSHDAGMKIQPKIKGLSGEEVKKQDNIKNIHNTVTNTSGTPYSSITVAYEHLKKDSGKYTERWLVVITDGDSFAERKTGNDLDKTFSRADEDGIKVVYLAIQQSQGGKTVKPSNTGAVTVYDAMVDNKDGANGILSQVTGICQQIFQRPSVASNTSKFDLSIPVSEIVVFAQGSNVNIGELAGAKKTVTSAKMSAEDKKYATSNGDSKPYVITTDLAGTVATFTPSSGEYLDSGSYNINVTADEYVIYYKPCLDVILKIKDGQGNVITDEVIPTGQYAAEYWLTYPKTHPRYGEKISTNLFDVDYTLYVKGDDGRKQIATSNTIMLDVGKRVEVSVTANYLNYISSDKSLIFAVEDFTVEELGVELEYIQEKYILSRLKTENGGIIVKVNKNGSPLTGDEWNRCGLEMVAEGVDFEVKKNDDSTFLVKPTYKNNDRASTATGNVAFQAVATISDGRKPTHKGSASGSVNIYDDITAVKLGVKVIKTPDGLKSVGFNESKPYVTVRVDWAGNQLTKEQYDALKLDVKIDDVEMVEVNGEKRPILEATKIELDPYTEGQHTTAKIYFNANGSESEQRKNLDDNDEFIVTATIEREGLISKGKTEGDLDIGRVYTPFEIALFIAFIILILCYLPPIKRYLPWKVVYEGKNHGRWEAYKIHPYFNFKALLTLICPVLNVRSDLKVEYTQRNLPCEEVISVVPRRDWKLFQIGRDRHLIVTNKEMLDGNMMYIDASNARNAHETLKTKSSRLCLRTTEVVRFTSRMRY